MSKNIKPGFQLHIKSWQNDGDNYKTKILSGLTWDETEFYILIARQFISSWKKDNDEQVLLPFFVVSNDENSSVELFNMWRYAADMYPEVAAKILRLEDGEKLPTIEQLELYDEESKLRYNDPRKEDEKYKNLTEAEHFLDFIHDFLSEMLDSGGEDYWDELNYVRVCDGIQVFYVPGDIENVTHKFIKPNKEI